MKTDGARHELEHRADMTRARLLSTIDALDRKRREIFDWKLQVRRHAGDILSAAGGLLIGVGATAAVVLYRQRRHERHVREERMRAIVRLWHHPERIAARHGVLGTAVRLVLVVLTTMATTTFGTRQLERVRKRPRLPAPPSEPLGL